MAYTPSDKRSHVKEAQTYLRGLSYFNPEIPRIAVDGIYGIHTAEAVKAFQRWAGLPDTGAIDRATWQELARAYAKTGAGRPVTGIYPSLTDFLIQKGDHGNTVLLVQFMLDKVASTYSNLPRIPSSGDFDDQTAAAVIKFQQISGLPETGAVDRDTWDHLAITYNSLDQVSGQ